MKKTERKKVLSCIEEAQKTTAPVTVSIGYTDSQGLVDNEGIVLKDAPHSIIEALQTEFKDRLLLEVSEDGLHIDLLGGK